MSGIAAILNRSGKPGDDATLWMMLDAIAYRGPDGISIRLHGPAALGYAKLTITPEEIQEHQPLVSARTGCLIAADVRLDNRDDIIAGLPQRVRTTTSDADLMLHAYECWGIDFVKRLLGDFAFVIWDPGARRMVCGRDTSGQRSLFFHANDETVLVASEIQQIFQDNTVPIEANEQRIRDYLTPWFTFQNEKQGLETFYANISSVPPGNLLIIDPDRVRLEPYWEFQPQEIRYRSDALYFEHFRDLFFQVVRDKVRTAYSTGALLSGGLDSSALVATVQELFQNGQAVDRGFTTFSSTFGDLECDEQIFIEALQEKYRFNARFVHTEAFRGRLQAHPTEFRESPNSGVPEASNALFRAIDQSATRVLLTGDMADASVGGTRLIFDSLLRRGAVREYWKHLQPHRRVTGDSLAKIAILHSITPLMPSRTQRQIMTLYYRRTFEQLRHRLLPDWMPEALRTDLSNYHFELLLDAEARRMFANPTREYEYRLLYPPEVARQSQPWPVQIVRPYSDRRLHEFLLGMPPDLKFAPHPDTDNTYAGQKQILRRSMAGILPESIRNRTHKTNFRGVWESEIEQQWQEYVAAFGSSEAPEIVRRGYVEQATFWNQLKALRNGQLGSDFLYVMNLVSLETWLRSIQMPRSQLVRTQTFRQSKVIPENGRFLDSIQHTQL